MMDSIKSFIQNILIKTTGYYLQKHEKIRHIDCVTTIKALLRHYQPKYLCDIGANKGTWAKVLYEFAPNSLRNITFFEPQQKYYRDLQNLELGNIKKQIFNVGLGDKEFEAEIIGGNATASFFQFDQSMKEYFVGELDQDKEKAKIKTLDKVYEYNNLPLPDLVKIDVQGYEKKVIEGGINIISQTKYLVIELSMDKFYKKEASMWEVLKLLEELNFRLIDFGFEWRIDYNPEEKLVYVDGIFVNRNFMTKA